MIVIVMGVAGAGKTTIGELLARELDWLFYDGDDFHPQANKIKMARGIALGDSDRKAWLYALRELIAKCLNSGTDAVLASSVLRRSYRDELVIDRAQIAIVYLRASRQLIQRRLENRKGHFFDPLLLDSQFEALEEPAEAIEVDASMEPGEVVRSIRASLKR